MKSFSNGFSFLTLILVLISVVSHLALAAGVFSGLASLGAYQLLTKVSVGLVAFNLIIVVGFRYQKIWAFHLASIDMMLFLVWGISLIFRLEFSSIFWGSLICIGSLKTLVSLRSGSIKFKAAVGATV